MKPPPFRYDAPTTVQEALDMLAGHEDEEARVLAGGQSLIPLMNFRLAQPSYLVDLNRVAELSYVRRDGSALAVGAMTRQSALERSPEAMLSAPLLVEAVGQVGHPPIRHRGTVGGAMAHADPAAELPAAAVAADAEMVVVGPRGRRIIPAAAFFLGPFTTALEPGEILTEVRVPSWPAGTGYAFAEFARTHGNFAVVGVAALVGLDGSGEGRVSRAALALCGVGGTPVRAAEAERRLVGSAPGDEVIRAAAEAATTGLAPAPDVQASGEYRLTLARTYVERALRQALARAKAGRPGGEDR